MALVLLYHLWPGVLPGGFVGVDVFFVISGFLITSHLLTSAPATGGDLAVFWMRRVRRLLPAALLVLTVTVLAARLLAPEAVWRDTARHAISSALYVENWHLADTSVDYFADSPPSPLQHYWSLSVEEQYYLFWPLLVLACVLLARRLRRRLEVLVLVAVSTVLVASLAYSISYTASDPARAYFVTGMRVWELAVGALLAVGVRLAVPQARRAHRTVPPVPRNASVFLVWAGLGAIGLAAAGYDAGAYPGSKALLPVLGAAAVIAAGIGRGPASNRLLCLPPMRFLGDVSYSLYLWHWPLIILTPQVLGRELNSGDKVVIGAASIGLAALSTHLIENPVRQWRPQASAWVPIRFAAVGTAAVVALSWSQVAVADARLADQLEQVAAAAERDDPCFAADSLRPKNRCSQPNTGPVVPAPAVAAQDRSFSYGQDCQLKVPFRGAPKTCVFGDPKGTRHIALVGNSHAIQWLPALHEIALRRDLKITTFFSEQCFVTDARIKFDTSEATTNCHAWGRNVLERIKAEKFDLVVRSERTYKIPVGGGLAAEVFTAGYRTHLKELLAAGERVLVIRDNPDPESGFSSPAACVDRHQKAFDRCAGQKSEWVNPDPLADAATALKSPRVQVVNLTPWFCPGSTCPAVIGGALVYADGTHITSTYGRSLAPVIEAALREMLKAPKKKA